MMPAFAGRMPRPLFALDTSLVWMSRTDVPPAALGWDRGFESGSLQRRVSNEPAEELSGFWAPPRENRLRSSRARHLVP